MQEHLLIRTPGEATASRLEPGSAPRLPRRKRVLLVDPSHFRIEYAINPHMRTSAGDLNTIDAARARKQWQALRDAYAQTGLTVETLTADPRYPDMVFAANQAFPYPDPRGEAEAGKYAFVPSRMAHDERAGEVPLVSAWLKEKGYRETPLPENVRGSFESGGDLTWFGDRRLLVGGIGKRTRPEALKAVADLIECPVIVLEMDDPDFYHLDTCLSFLDDRTALWVPHAFKATSQKLLSSLVENLIAVDDLEARRGLACNAHSTNGHTIFLPSGNPHTSRELETLGYEVVEIDTSEFLKAGGSVYCMKMMYW
jgi:N-dimethylarginine dimethylaminohydrolase